MNIHAQRFDLNLAHSFQTAHGADSIRHNAYLKLTEGGLSGYGEAAPLHYYNEYAHTVLNAVEEIRKLEIGDFRNYREATGAVWKNIKGEFAAKAAMDMAIYDLAGKDANLPLYRMLGINPDKTPVSSFTIGIDTKEIIELKVKEAEQYPLLKIKLGGGNDEEIMNTIRALTDKPVRVDANCGWTLKEGIEKVQWLADMNVEFVEQPFPVDKIDNVRELRKHSKLPIIADENSKRAEDIPGLYGAFDGINIKLMKCGGISEALNMIALARTYGMKIMLGCMVETSLAITAAAHLSPLVDYVDLDGNLLIKNDPFNGAITTNGRMTLPDKPGLGVTCDETFWQ